MRFPKATILLIASMVACLAGVAALSLLLKPTAPSGTGTVTETTKEGGLPFAMPAKKGGSFHTIYGNRIQFDVAPLKTNLTDNTIHGATQLKIHYYNPYQEPLAPADDESPALDIGCIVEYRDRYITVVENPGMFTGNEFRTLAHSAEAIGTVPPWGSVDVVIDLNPACRYAGTADLEYYWKIR